jgi:hypothetical protein
MTNGDYLHETLLSDYINANLHAHPAEEREPLKYPKARRAESLR